MVKKSRQKPTVKRFSVSLDMQTYDKLAALAASYRPPLTLQYLVQAAVERLLDSAADPQLDLGLTFPPPVKGR